MRQLERRFMIVAAFGMLAWRTAAQPMRREGGPAGAPGTGLGRGPGAMVGHHGPMMGGSRGMSGRFANTTNYLSALKVELDITATQEKAWEAYADAVTGAADQMRALHQSMWESMYTATWEERRDMMNRAFQARAQSFKITEAAAQALLPALSERQQGKAEVILPGLAGPRWHSRRW